MTAKTHKMLKVTIAGYYKAYDGEIVDFSGISGVIPYTTEEHAKMHVRGRYAKEWIKENNKKTPGSKSVESVPSIHIDDIEVVEGVPSFLGKDIKTLNVMELQDLATSKDLRTIPTPDDCRDKRAAQEKAYKAYSNNVLGKKLKPDVGFTGFNFAKLPPIMLNDASGRVDDTVKTTNEAVLAAEQKAGQPTPMGAKDDRKSALTLKDLKDLAEQEGFEYDESLLEDDLYNVLYRKFFP